MNPPNIQAAGKLLNELIESLTQAAGATTQLLHAHQDPRWMIIREALELSKDGIAQVATIPAVKYSGVRPI